MYLGPKITIIIFYEETCVMKCPFFDGTFWNELENKVYLPRREFKDHSVFLSFRSPDNKTVSREIEFEPPTLTTKVETVIKPRPESKREQETENNHINVSDNDTSDSDNDESNNSSKDTGDIREKDSDNEKANLNTDSIDNGKDNHNNNDDNNSDDNDQKDEGKETQNT